MKPKKLLGKIIFSLVILFSSQSVHCFSETNKIKDSTTIYISNGDFQKGLRYSKIQSNHFLREKKYFEFCNAIVLQATIYNLLGNNELALDLLLKTLKSIKNIREKNCEIILIKKISEIFILIKDFKNAKIYLYDALIKVKKIKNDSLNNRIDQSLFKIHMLTKSDSSFFYLKKVNTYFKKMGDDLSYYFVYGNNFNYYIANGNLKLAKLNIDSCVYYAKKSGSKDRILLALGNLVYNQVEIEGDYKKGKETYLEIFKITNDSSSSRIAEHYFSYGNVLQYLGNYKEANKYLVKSIYIKDSLYKKNISSAVRDVEMKYKIQKIKNEYKKKQHLLVLEQSKNKKINYIIVSLLIIITILFYFFFQNSQLKQKNKLKDIESEIQENTINASIDGQELERKKIAAFLHDNISALLSTAGLHLNVFTLKNHPPSEEIIKTKALLIEAHDKVRDLSHELMPSLLARFGLFHALEDLCEKNSNSRIHFEFSTNVEMSRRYNEEFEMKLYFIITELLNNVIKHSSAENATVSIEELGNMLSIQVSNNGEGFDTQKQNNYEGFGLNQIRSRINKMKGTILINSFLDLGTIIFIKVPISYKE